jgi:hypothetical protein
MDKKTSIRVLSHLLTALIVYIGCYYYTTHTTHTTTVKTTPHTEGDIYTDYTPQDFKMNYQIDLKQDGYLILDTNGDVYYVPFFDLEDWFLRMNL